MRRAIVTAAAVAVVSACAMRMGNPDPVEYQAVAIAAGPAASAEQTAAQIRAANADVALLVAAHDSAWISDVARRAELVSTRPGRLGEQTFAFLGAKPVGDTTLAIKVQSGGELKVHDALYNIDKNRHLDLLTVSIDRGTSVRDAVARLLGYVATDVFPNAAIILAVHTATPEQADTMAVATRAAMGDAWECTQASRQGGAPSPANLRLFYFPAARISCESARVLDSPPGITAQLIVQR